MSNSSRLIVTTILALAIAVALALVLVLATGTGVVLAEDHPNGDVISPTQTIDGTWGPSIITATANVTIDPGVVITIAPNTTVLVADGVGFTVQGDLHSDGPITFTTASTPAVPGGWEGITYADGSNGYLNEATIEYGVHAIVLSTTNPIVISNSIIRYSKQAPPAASGLRCDGSGTANPSCPSGNESQGYINQGG